MFEFSESLLNLRPYERTYVLGWLFLNFLPLPLSVTTKICSGKQISMFLQCKLLVPWGFSPLPVPSGFCMREEPGAVCEIVPVSRGGISLPACLWNLGGLSLWPASLAPDFLASTEQRPLGKKSVMSTDSPCVCTPRNSRLSC